MLLWLNEKARLDTEWPHVWFDCSHQHSLLLKSGSFFIWTHEAHPRYLFKTEDVLPSNIIFGKLSLDQEFVSLQVSPSRVIVLGVLSKKKWVIDIKSPDENHILGHGLIWSEHGGNSQDLVLVTHRGLELYKISSVRGQCKLSRTITHPDVAYFWYEPNHRMILLASPQKLNSPQEKELFRMNGYFFRAEISDMPKLELPPPEKIPPFDLGPGVTGDDIDLVTLFGNLYCTVHFTSEGSDYISMYGISKAGAMRAHLLTLKTFSRNVRVSVVDNLLCCHLFEQNGCLIYDLKKPVLKSESNSGNVIEALSAITPVGCAEEADGELCHHSMHAVSKLLVVPQDNRDIDSVSVDAEEWDAVGNVGTLPTTSATAISTDKEEDRFESSGILLDDPISEREAAENKTVVPEGDLSVSSATDVKAFRRSCVDYSEDWEFFPPNWLWNDSKRMIGRLTYDLAAICADIADTRKALLFLAQREQPFRAPKSVYKHRLSSEGLSKKLMISRIQDCLREETSLHWMEAIFKIVIVPYANEVKRMNLLSEQCLRFSHPSVSSHSYEMEHANRLLSVNNGLINNPIGQFSQDSSRVKSFTFGNYSSSATGLLGLSNSTIPMGTNSSVDVSFISPEPLEPEHAMYLLLPSITAVGGRTRLRGHSVSSVSGYAVGENEQTIQLPLTSRRDSQGSLVLSQTELLIHTWLPVVYDRSVAPSFKKWALLTYISCLRSSTPPILVQPTLCILLLNLLVSNGDFIELSQLLQLQFLTDSTEVAMTALELSDVLIEIDHERELPTSSKSVSQIQLRCAVKVLQQVGLDMLWRIHERATVVRWLLGKSRVMEAITLCSKIRGQWKTGLTPGSISGVDFYVSALNFIQKLGITNHDDANERTRLQGMRCELMHTVCNFIRDWDHTVLSVSAANNMKSRLAISSPFPEHLFSPDQSKILKDIFGYA